MTQEHPPLTEGVYYILLALFEARHGYGIMQFVEEMSNGRVRLGAGTIYGAIKTLLERGWIEALDDDGRKKEYMITESGKKVVEYEILRLRELFDNGIRITQEDGTNA
ncbi:PadR family transcriptional regulator [Lysinibacillus sp. TE18511]